MHIMQIHTETVMKEYGNILWKLAHSGEVIIAICAFLNAYFRLPVLKSVVFRRRGKLDATWKIFFLFFWFLS